jgi:hypothetical protein
MTDDVIQFPQKPEPGPAQRDLVDGMVMGGHINLGDGQVAEITAEGLGFTDMEAAINMRMWLQHACEEKGAKVVGSGYGFGAGDLDLEIEGFLYNVSIKPIAR